MTGRHARPAAVRVPRGRRARRAALDAYDAETLTVFGAMHAEFTPEGQRQVAEDFVRAVVVSAMRATGTITAGFSAANLLTAHALAAMAKARRAEQAKA